MCVRGQILFCICSRACGYSMILFLVCMDIGKVWCHLTWSVAGLRESIQRSKQANRRSLVNHKLVARAAMDNFYGALCGHIPWTKSDLTKMGRHNLVGTSAFRSHSSVLHLYLHILYRWTTAPRCIHPQVQRDSAQQSFIPLTMQHCQAIWPQPTPGNLFCGYSF